MLSEGLFGVSTKKLTEMMTGKPEKQKEKLSDIFEQKNSESSEGPTRKPSIDEFIPKGNKPTSTSLATGKLFRFQDTSGLRDDPLGLKQKGAPPLVVDRPNRGVYAPKQYWKEKTTPKIRETTSIARDNCKKLEERREKLEKLKKQTEKMGKNAEEFADAMKSLKKQEEGCVISGGKNSRKKKKRHKNRKKALV